MPNGQLPVRPSDFVKYEYYDHCRLFLHRAATESEAEVRERSRLENEERMLRETAQDRNGADAAISATEKGNIFERRVISALRAEGAHVISPSCSVGKRCTDLKTCPSLRVLEESLLKVRDTSEEVDCWFDQLHVLPPSTMLAEGNDLLTCGVMLCGGYSDLIRLSRNAGTQTATLHVIDIKYSPRGKVSHERQVTLYVLYLLNLLSPEAQAVVSKWEGSVWLPSQHDQRPLVAKSATDQRKRIPSTAVSALPLKELVFSFPVDLEYRKTDVERYFKTVVIPSVSGEVTLEDLEDTWQWNPSCRECPYKRNCEQRAAKKPLLPNPAVTPSTVLVHQPNHSELFAARILDATEEGSPVDWDVDLAEKSLFEQREIASSFPLRVDVFDPLRPAERVGFSLPQEQEAFCGFWEGNASSRQCLVASSLAKRQLVQLLWLWDTQKREYWKETVMSTCAPTEGSLYPHTLRDNVFVFEELFNRMVFSAWMGWAQQLPIGTKVHLLLCARGEHQYERVRLQTDASSYSTEGLLMALGVAFNLHGRVQRPFLRYNSIQHCGLDERWRSLYVPGAFSTKQTAADKAKVFLQNHFYFMWYEKRTAAEQEALSSAVAVKVTTIDESTGGLWCTPLGEAENSRVRWKMQKGQNKGHCSVQYRGVSEHCLSQKPLKLRFTLIGRHLFFEKTQWPEAQRPRMDERLLLFLGPEYTGLIFERAAKFLNHIFPTPKWNLLEHLFRERAGVEQPTVASPFEQTDANTPVKERFTVAGHEASTEQMQFLSATCSANPITVLWGPPGTGKSATLASTMHTLLATYTHLRILVTANTNNALDVLCELLCAESRTKGEIEGILRLSELSGEEAKRRVPHVRAIFGTIFSVYSNIVALEGPGSLFDVLVIDEASMLPVVYACFAAQLLHPNKHKIILAGDLLQLQAIVPERICDNPQVVENGWEHLCGSVLQACLSGDPKKPLRRVCDLYTLFAEGDLPPHVVQLGRSYRSDPSIVQLISPLYPRGLVAESGQTRRGVFGDALAVRELAEQESEEDAVVDCIKALNAAHPRCTVFVCCPHRRQRERIVLHHGCVGKEHRVDTVERFQGAECDVAILCYGRDIEPTKAFAFDLFRAIVAMSRAKSKVILVLDRLKHDLLKWQPRGAAPFHGADATSMPRDGWALFQEFVKVAEPWHA